MRKPRPLKISIITPSFNQGHFIRQTIESVVGQAGQRAAYIVVDGGSTDETKRIVSSYEDVLFVSEKDNGQTDALNKGLRRLMKDVGDDDIVAYINSDDYYMPEAFATVRDVFEKNPHVQWVVGDALIVDSVGHPIQSLIRIYKKILRLFPRSVYITNPYPQPSVFLRGRVVKQLGNFREDLRYTMDYEYWLRVLKHFGPPLVIPECLSAFRIHGQSKGGSQYEKQFREELAVLTEYIHNPLVTMLHRIHTELILFVYAWIKRSL